MAEPLLPLAEQKGDELALVDEFVERTYVEVNERVNRLVSALREAGLGVGAVAGLLSGNRNEFFELITALGHTGVTFVPINWHFTPEEIAYVLEDSGATALFADHQYGELAVAAAERVSAVRHKVIFGGAPAEGFVAHEELVASGAPTEPANQCAGFVMFYTSGTTGKPKGVKSSLVLLGGPVAAIQATVDAFGTLLKIPRDGKALVNSPVYHARPYLMSAVASGIDNALVIRRRFDPAEMLRADRRAPDHDRVRGAHALREAPAPARRGQALLRRVQPAVRVAHCHALPAGGQAPAHRVVGAGYLRVLRGDRGRWLRNRDQLGGVAGEALQRRETPADL
jgi:long-chain acyl-CoA synthetase